jgi:hypothetical protein
LPGFSVKEGRKTSGEARHNSILRLIDGDTYQLNYLWLCNKNGVIFAFFRRRNLIEKNVQLKNNLDAMDLAALRNLFLSEMRSFLAALETEGPENLQLRKERIREIDEALEKRKQKFRAKSFV